MQTDAEWDVLATLLDDAWCWRDPESVAALEACLLRLKARVFDEWGD